MCAYDEMDVSYAQRALGGALHYAVHDLKMNADEFFSMFINSKIAYGFGLGEAKYVLGMSGAELAMETIYVLTGKCPNKKPSYAPYKTPEYWAGWALAYFEWESEIPFESIVSKVPVSQIIDMYSPYHEMDVRQFSDEMHSLINA